jgi:hypothetical protein
MCKLILSDGQGFPPYILELSLIDRLGKSGQNKYMSTNISSIKTVFIALLMLLLLSSCGLFRAKETPVIVVFPSPTPGMLITPDPGIEIGPPQVEVDILNTPLPELFADFPTPTPDTIFIPPTPTDTPVVIIIIATPVVETPIVPTPTPHVDVVLPVTGADLTTQPGQIPTWPVGVLMAGIILVTFGLFRMRR